MSAGVVGGGIEYFFFQESLRDLILCEVSDFFVFDIDYSGSEYG